ncbi:hypothetical protein [Salisaeta longa]|uniref:hypothetical protein n=1 Tax=Salisaeta longa TaxID=503170 RepID=UPI000686F660|nr:hypothetical protein [Salisaeta longa]
MKRIGPFHSSDQPLASPRGPRTYQMALLGLAVLLAVSLLRWPLWGQALVTRFAPVTAPAVPETTSAVGDEAFTMRQSPQHPDARYAAYFGRAAAAPEAPDSLQTSAEAFQELLEIYRYRMVVDDNFTVRVTDRRTNKTLEVYVLEEQRAAYRRGADVDWGRIDAYRRDATRRLVDKWAARGIPRDAITVKWGRRNQVELAHQRDLPYVAYEIRLAQALGLSLLPTEIGTVETFNQDHLVSSVGARSRYQMMPYILRRRGLNQYRLETIDGAAVQVHEERHPLLAMEPAFLLLKGYANAVGHEVPGMSAYHSGPGNIFNIYRLFYMQGDRFTTETNVLDAYIWGLTKGFEAVNEVSTFGYYSRGYIPTAYSTLQVAEQAPIPLDQTMRAVRVQLERGRTVRLDSLLQALHRAGMPTTYEQFRTLNKHFDLPPATVDGGIPEGGNVQLVAFLDGAPVRFFLPLGAPKRLTEAGLDVLAARASFRFDETTYGPPAPSQVTVWDEQYAALVDDIKQFGFTQANRERLLVLYEKFAQLAEANPSPYRRRQLDIITTHRRLWLSSPFERLADATMMALGRLQMPVQPPVTLAPGSSSSLTVPAPTMP